MFISTLFQPSVSHTIDNLTRNQTGRKIALLPTLLVLCVSSSYGVELTQEELAVLQDWEVAQKNYPQTEKLEKVGDQVYDFANRGIGYDGKLVVDNVLIDTDPIYNAKTAEIYVTLDKSEEAFYEENNQSYMRWEATANELYYDEDSSQWVTYNNYIGKEFSDEENYEQCETSDYSQDAELQENSNVIRDLITSSFPVFLIIFVFAMLYRWYIKKVLAQQNKQISLVKQALESNQQTIQSNDNLAKEINLLTKYLTQNHETIKNNEQSND